MGTSLKHLIWIFVWNVHFATSDAVGKKTAVECILDHQPSEVYLNCQPQGIINILSAHVGYQELTQDTAVCVSKTPEDCSVEMTDLGPLLGACMGMGVCNKVVYHPDQDLCGHDINYIQVDYECIPDNEADPLSVVDICGDIFGQTKSISRHQGYIRSLGYPGNYSPQTTCSCSLSTDGKVLLDVLDLDLGGGSTSPAQDWLEYTATLDQWGEGRRLGPGDTQAVVDTESGQVHLNFRTDSRDAGRGFWVQYEGVTEDGQSASEVKIHCGEHQPPDYKSSSACYQDETMGELYLHCQSQGVINVISAVRGYQANLTYDECSPSNNHSCSESAMEDDELLMCMGRVECNPPARKTALPACTEHSNYMHVVYQCVQEHQGDASAITDMCGDSDPTAVMPDLTVGYLETLNYPAAYFPNQKCTCRLQSVNTAAEIILSLLDLGLDNKDCAKTKDWIEFTSADQTWGGGARLCGHSPGEAIHTKTSALHLNFFSDVNVEGRGVWLKYMAKAPDGNLSPLRVICGQYDPDNDLDYRTDSPYDGPATVVVSPEDNNRTGLIAGLSVTALLMIIVMVVMFLIYRQRRPGKTQTPPENAAPGGPQPPTSAIGRMDTGYGTLKYPGFSTKKDGHGMPYTTLDEEPNSSPNPGGVRATLRERTPTIARISGAAMPSTHLGTSSPKVAGSGSSSTSSGKWSGSSVSSEPTSSRSEIAYRNPAFEESWGGGQDKRPTGRHLKI